MKQALSMAFILPLMLICSGKVCKDGNCKVYFQNQMINKQALILIPEGKMEFTEGKAYRITRPDSESDVMEVVHALTQQYTKGKLLSTQPLDKRSEAAQRSLSRFANDEYNLVKILLMIAGFCCARSELRGALHASHAVRFAYLPLC